MSFASLVPPFDFQMEGKLETNPIRSTKKRFKLACKVSKLSYYRSKRRPERKSGSITISHF